MISINPAFQVLVVSDNIAAIAAGSTIDQLAPGQIGFFSYQTNLAIDGTTANNGKGFYMAVGVDRLSAGTIQDVNKSAGVCVEKVRAFSLKPYQASQNKIITLTIGKVACNVEYGIKFEIRSELAYRNYGFNTPTKTFTAFSAACSDACVDCATGDSNSVVLGLAAEIALDPDKIFTTAYLDPTDSSVVLAANVANWRNGINALAVGTVTPTGSGSGGTLAAATYKYKVTALNAQGESLPSAEASVTTSGTTSSVALAWAAVTGATSYKIYRGTTANGENVYFTSNTNSFSDVGGAGTAGVVPVVGTAVVGNVNANLVLQLQITINANSLKTFSQININYLDPRQINAYLSILTDPNSSNGTGTFGPDTTQVDSQALIYEDGAGYDIQQLEYVAGGWNGKPGPYRVSELVGVPTGFFEYFATTNGQYNLYALNYENTGIGGGQKYQSSLATFIAVPTANTTARDSINATLHRLVDNLTSNDGTVNGLYPATNSFAEIFQ